ncbi:MAG: hypothetical protein M1826_005406 [Phylliscum demangeonii]|nr:MAG: hypothetical protein M1826_005406 [Phylliscum demangeonii]
MSIPNEALEKLMREIETQAMVSQQQINVVKGQLAAKRREARLLQLTAHEVNDLPQDTNVYEGVGKIFVSVPVAEVKNRLAGETGGLRSDISSLEKKLHYLETTHKNSREHIEQIMKSDGRS